MAKSIRRISLVCPKSICSFLCSHCTIRQHCPGKENLGEIKEVKHSKAPDVGSVLAVVLSPAWLAVTSHKPSKINTRNSSLRKMWWNTPSEWPNGYLRNLPLCTDPPSSTVKMQCLWVFDTLRLFLSIYIIEQRKVLLLHFFAATPVEVGGKEEGPPLPLVGLQHPRTCCYLSYNLNLNVFVIWVVILT